MVGTLAFHAGVRGSIPRMNQHIFNFPFSQSHPSGITKPSSKAYLLLQGLRRDKTGQNRTGTKQDEKGRGQNRTKRKRRQMTEEKE